MILGANQPYFLPYIAYWQLIHASDLFLIGDDYVCSRGSWIPRNRILVHGQPRWFGIEVNRTGASRLCSELTLMPIDRRKKMNQLYDAYHRAPCYPQGIRLMEEILGCREEILSEFLLSSIKAICRYLGITTPIGRTSDLAGNSRFRREERIYDLCGRQQADTYVNPVGGTKLYDFEEFRRRGIRLQFLHSCAAPYQQYKEPFVGNLSILDVIMFNSVEEIRRMLDQYTWITAPDKSCDMGKPPC